MHTDKIDRLSHLEFAVFAFAPWQVEIQVAFQIAESLDVFGTKSVLWKLLQCVLKSIEQFEIDSILFLLYFVQKVHRHSILDRNAHINLGAQSYLISCRCVFDPVFLVEDISIFQEFCEKQEQDIRLPRRHRPSGRSQSCALEAKSKEKQGQHL